MLLMLTNFLPLLNHKSRLVTLSCYSARMKRLNLLVPGFMACACKTTIKNQEFVSFDEVKYTRHVSSREARFLKYLLAKCKKSENILCDNCHKGKSANKTMHCLRLKDLLESVLPSSLWFLSGKSSFNSSSALFVRWSMATFCHHYGDHFTYNFWSGLMRARNVAT